MMQRDALSPDNEFSTAGEAAYAAAAAVTDCDQRWSEENQDKWEEAAAAAILFGRQRAAVAQIAYFKTHACVPYHIGEGDAAGKLFTAQLMENGVINILVDGEIIRRVDCGEAEDAIRWFSSVVMAPPGFVFY